MSSMARCSNSSATGRSPDFSALPMAPSYSSELPIAFSKIDGFEVTPLTPSVSINFFRREGNSCQPALKGMLTGEICVLRKYNAIHNISIPKVDIDPRAGGCLTAMSARFCDGCHDVGQWAGQVALGAGRTIRRGTDLPIGSARGTG